MRCLETKKVLQKNAKTTHGYRLTIVSPAVALLIACTLQLTSFAQAPSTAVTTPASGYEQPSYAPPPQAPAQVPAQAPAQAPPQYQPPQDQYQPPQGQYQPPQGQYQPPQGQYQPPQEQYQPPQGQYQPPQGQYQPPPGQYQQPQYSVPANGYPPQGYGQAPPQYGQPQAYGQPPYGGQPQFQQGGVAYAQAGTTISVALRTSISTQVAKEGDFIEAAVTQAVPLGGYASIPAGSVVAGQITSAEAGRRLSRSGALSITFNQLRLPSGVTVPIQAHLASGVGKYKEKDNGQLRGEGGKAKLGQTAIRGGLGAGLGAALGTGVGAIAGGGYGAGMGAWSGAAIGGGLGVGDMLLRKGRDVTIQSGTTMDIQLDQPVTIPDTNGTVQQPATGGVF
jgi:hypothetical protein